MAVSEIEDVMQLVGRSCCLLCAQTWMLCSRCSCLSTCQRLDGDLGGFYRWEYVEYDDWLVLCTLKRGEGVVGKAATSSHNLVYCDYVSQFSITEYPLAHFARFNKLTACFATCLRSNHTGNQIYVLEFFLNPCNVKGMDGWEMLVPILEGMRKNFRTFKLASGEEIGDNLSVQVLDARVPEKLEILEIGKLDSEENCTIEMELIHNGENMVNTIEGVAIASLDKQRGELPVDVADAIFLQQPVHIDGLAMDNGENMGSNIDEHFVEIASLENQHNNATISNDNRGGELVVDGLAIDKVENMGSNIGEQPAAIASWENQHNNATISSIGVINSNISLQPLVEVDVVHTEENIWGAPKLLNSELPPWNGIDISLKELMKVSGMKLEDAAKRLNGIIKSPGGHLSRKT